MTQRTCNIIMACKGCICPEIEEPLERVKLYMANECACPLTVYTRKRIDGIMFDAMCDYLDTCDKPSFFFKEMERLFEKEYFNRAEQIANTFRLVEVMDGEKYINGFTAELLKDEIVIEIS